MADEQTPLVAKEEKSKNTSTVHRVLFCAFVISLSIAFTWVPMLYEFRLMTCEQYYTTHDQYIGDGDRCSINEIEATTAKAISLLGTTTTIFGVLNLLFAGWTIKRFGVKAALIQQTVWPAVRLCCQIIAVTIGAKEGMMIIQITQFICMLGGPAGYLLALNTYTTELVEPSKRTGVFGQLQGCVMFGTAFGYLLGGTMASSFGMRRPWEIAFFLMIFSTVYTLLFLPYVAPHRTAASSKTPKPRGLAAFFGPARLFMPQKFQLPNGRIQNHWGVFLLGAGVFWGVLATGFIPVLIQMYATNRFGFQPIENGYLMSFNSLIRGCFLSFAFPKIISGGRKWFASNVAVLERTTQLSDDTIPVTVQDFEVVPGLESEQEPAIVPATVKVDDGSAFDLFFLKWSLVVDGALTGSAAFSTQGWHIYVAAFLLPLASGSAPAAKGVMMEMCEPSQRSGALSAITLVEMIATLSTMSVFGLVFSYLAELGKPQYVFFCNAGVAVFAVAILAFSRFPPVDSKRIADLTPELDEAATA